MKNRKELWRIWWILSYGGMLYFKHWTSCTMNEQQWMLMSTPAFPEHAECVHYLFFRRDIISFSVLVSLSFYSDLFPPLEFLPPCFLVLLSVCSGTHLVLFTWQKKKVLYLPAVPSGSTGKEMLCLAETHLWKENQSGTKFFRYMYLRAGV